MPFRTWMLIAAIGIAASAYAQEDVSEPIAEPQSGNEQPSEQPTIDAEPPGSTSASPTDPTRTEHNRDTPPDGDDEQPELPEIILGDGWAQWAMAITGFGALCLSGWAVWLLSATLKATRKAVEESEKGTKAAIVAASAANEANRIAQTVQRPWMNFENKATGTMQDLSPNVSLDVTSATRNVGTLPALDVQVHSVVIKADIRRLNVRAVAEECLSDWLDERKAAPHGRVVFPETEFGSEQKQFQCEVITVHPDGDKYFLVRGVTYRSRDGGEIHHTVRLYYIYGGFGDDIELREFTVTQLIS